MGNNKDMSSNTEYSLRERYVDCLTQQLNELELLESMYPNRGDIILTNNMILNDIKYFINNDVQYTPGHLDFILNLMINGFKLEACINLPSLYPEKKPEVFVRCNHLNRQQETDLNLELSKNIKENHLGEVWLYSAISWIQENFDKFVTNTTKETKSPENHENFVTSTSKETKSPENHEKFARYWIYSHHIYNKKKREEVVKKAKELNLTGFCLPGKPGVICTEGSESECREWWKDIKSMNWKKITVRKIELYDYSEQVEHQKFSKFEELLFKKNAINPKFVHADMGRFSKFMDECGLLKTFNEILGICNSSD